MRLIHLDLIFRLIMRYDGSNILWFSREDSAVEILINIQQKIMENMKYAKNLVKQYVQKFVTCSKVNHLERISRLVIK